MLTCQTCGCEFSQAFDPEKRPKPETEAGEEKKTLRAAKANGQGPFCPLCRHLEMALRYAEGRHLEDCAINIRRAQRFIPCYR